MSERGGGNILPFPGLTPDDIQTEAAVGPLAPAGGGPHDPDMEARVAKLEALTEMTNTSLGRIESRIDRLEGRIDGMDGRLRAVEQRLAEISGKIDILIGSVVGKLPTWWQMPAVIGSTVALLVLLYAGVRYLQSHGLL